MLRLFFENEQQNAKLPDPTTTSETNEPNGLPASHPAAHITGVRAEIVDLEGEDVVPAEIAVAEIPNSAKSPARPTGDDREVFQFSGLP